MRLTSALVTLMTFIDAILYRRRLMQSEAVGIATAVATIIRDAVDIVSYREIFFEA